MSDDLAITRMKVAFAFHVATMIVDADDRVDPKEMLMMTEAFPRELLDGLAFVDDKNQFTGDYYAAVDEALEVLPGYLSDEEKLRLVTIFARISFSDGDLDLREGTLLMEAAQYLGLSEAQVRAHLFQN